MSDERPKKSWREIDQGKDSSSHRQSSQDRGVSRHESGQAYRSYKTQLNKLFDGGGELPEALKQKLEDSGLAQAGRDKKAALKKVSDAKSESAKATSFLAYVQAYGAPVDENLLAEILDLDDEEDATLSALEILSNLFDEGRLKRLRSLKLRLGTLSMTHDDDDVVAAAKQLLVKLK